MGNDEKIFEFIKNFTGFKIKEIHGKVTDVTGFERKLEIKLNWTSLCKYLEPNKELTFIFRGDSPIRSGEYAYVGVHDKGRDPKKYEGIEEALYIKLFPGRTDFSDTYKNLIKPQTLVNSSDS